MVYQPLYPERLVCKIPDRYYKWIEPLIRLVAVLYYATVSFSFTFYNMFRRRKVVPPIRDPLLPLSATRLAEKLRKRETSASAIMRAYTARIKEVNPIINVIVVDNTEEALVKAVEADKIMENMSDSQLEQLFNEKPLFGMPFTFKDSLSIDGQIVTVGLWFRKNERAEGNAVVVQRMLDAGAIFMATTNVPESVFWIESENSLYGMSNNPYDSRRTVGGSSGGEGALNGAAGTLMGMGSDLGGSIRVPSFVSGVFGWLDTPGNIPLNGHLPEVNDDSVFRRWMTHVGPITRFSEDIPLLCKIMGGDSYTNYLKAHPASSLDETKIFFMNGHRENPTQESVSSEMLQVLHKAVQHFENKYSRSASMLAFPESKKLAQIWCSGIKEGGFGMLREYLCSPEEEKFSFFPEIIRYWSGKSKHSFAGIVQCCFGDDNNMFSEEDFKELIEMRQKMRQRIIDLLGKDGVLIYPSYPTVAPFHHETVFKMSYVMHTGFVNVMTLPAVQVPMGLNKDGLPLGVTVIGAPNSDALLMAVAQELSDKFGGWVQPQTN